MLVMIIRNKGSGLWDATNTLSPPYLTAENIEGGSSEFDRGNKISSVSTLSLIFPTMDFINILSHDSLEKPLTQVGYFYAEFWANPEKLTPVSLLSIR